MSPRRNTRSLYANRISPLIHRLGSEDPEYRTRDQMASKVEGVVDGGMRAEHALNDVRQCGREPVELPLKARRRVSTPIGSSCAALSIEVSAMAAYGGGRVKRRSPPVIWKFTVV